MKINIKKYGKNCESIIKCDKNWEYMKNMQKVEKVWGGGVQKIEKMCPNQRKFERVP